MGKKKKKIIMVSEVNALIKEIKGKYRPDFFTVRESGGGSDGESNEIVISFGWKIQNN